MRKGDYIFLLLGALAIAVFVFFAIRDNLETNKCQAQYGRESKWAGQDTCYKPLPLKRADEEVK
jgi:hypothetical protein